MIRQHALIAFIALAATASTDAFSPALRPQTLSVGNTPVSFMPNDSHAVLWMSESEEAPSDDTEASAEAEAAEEEAEEEEPAEPEEDPEVTALKKEIEELEATLKGKKSTLAYTVDQSEEYSKGGYARKVAEMENMRRMRSSMNSSSRSSATAGILAEFLPIYDKMNDLNAKYADSEFGSKYSGLSLAPTFAKMGVTEYEVSPGEKLDRIRMIPKGSEHSEEFEKDTVITVLSTGMEMEGNVIRPVDCVVSLGAEVEETEEEEASEEGEAESEGAEEESSQ